MLYCYHIDFGYCGLPAKHTCISQGAHTLVLVDAIVALSVLTGVARAVIFIDLTVHP